MKKINQKHCPICGQKFDKRELAVHFGSRGPTYLYCACSKCKRAWEIGQLRHGTWDIERKEVRYLE
jgi:formate dehydrogenase maturation protein FdhE